MLFPGMLIKTNYSGPYRIKNLRRDCTCPSYLSQINDATPRRRPRHLRMVLTRPDGSGEFYLDGFIEESLQSLELSRCSKTGQLIHDWIEVIEVEDREVKNRKPIQMGLW